MNILLIGSGAREHALAVALARSPQTKRLCCYGTHANPGILPLCDQYAVGSLTELSQITRFAQTACIDIAIVEPRQAFLAGIVDHLMANNILCVGPTLEQAKIESSPGFLNDLIGKYKLSVLSATEKHQGPEFSMMTITDGETCKHTPLLQTHTRAYIDSNGPQTPGMGSYSCPDHLLPFVNAEDATEAQQINEQVVFRFE